jgi:hypothetical protein
MHLGLDFNLQNPNWGTRRLDNNEKQKKCVRKQKGVIGVNVLIAYLGK